MECHGDQGCPAKDPVCGMEVDESRAEHKTEYMGKTYYFCAPGCKAMFEKEPEKYTKEEKPTHHHM
jgi:YHS domain-containing protein